MKSAKCVPAHFPSTFFDSPTRSRTYQEVLEDPEPKTQNHGAEVAPVTTGTSVDQSKDFEEIPRSCAETREAPDTPLDVDVEDAILTHLAPSHLETAPIDGPARGRKRKLSRTETFVGNLSGPALLQWLTKRHCNRQEDPNTMKDPIFSKCGEDRRRAERYLQEQVLYFRDQLGGENQRKEEIILLPPPQMITSLQCAAIRMSQKAESSTDGFVTLLPSTRLPSNPSIAAQATDKWDSIQKNVVSEAAKAFTRSKLTPKAPVVLPWKSQEMLLEASDLQYALEMLQVRCDLEPGRRVLMRRAGAHPKAGIFQDPPQNSAEASAAAASAQSGVLPSMATGNEFQAAIFLQNLVEPLRSVRPGILGTWHPIQACRDVGFRDVLHCLWSSRDFCGGMSGHFVGCMMQAGCTKRAFGLSGGQEHCQCSCGDWLTRGKIKGHACSKHVGKPHGSSTDLKIFQQTRGVLAFRVLFKHHWKQHLNSPAVDITLEAGLESAIKSLIWSDFWEAAHIACSWRICAVQEVKETKHPYWRLKQPCCEAVPAQQGLPLTPQQLVLLGWMRLREASANYTSRQIMREDLCEAGFQMRPPFMYRLCSIV